MKRLFFIATVVLTINAFGQKLTGEVSGLQTSAKKSQRSLTMFYGNLSNENVKTVIFIDGKQASFIEFLTINPKFIDTYSIEKKAISINETEYKEQLYIKTKHNYQSKLTSLKDIRKKYVKDQNLLCVYFMDGRLVKIDDVDIFLDENNILEVTCHLYENVVENLKLNIIEIFTRSEENLKKADEIIIR